MLGYNLKRITPEWKSKTPSTREYVEDSFAYVTSAEMVTSASKTLYVEESVEESFAAEESVEESFDVVTSVEMITLSLLSSWVDLQ